MADEKLLTVRETASLLGISEKEVLDLAENGRIPAYKVGGVYLRFKREQVENFIKSSKPLLHKVDAHQKYSLRERIDDFFYFNDFYIFAVLIVLLILFIIFQG
jgi:excisionase family DNA binding protein